MDVQNEERALPYKEDWMIKIKRKKYLIKGGERIICVKTKSTNEKIRKELNGEENGKRKKINPILSVNKTKKQIYSIFYLFYFLFHVGEKRRKIKWNPT